tara:strand:- start:3198 stop:3566 length:369 start_codon:yes stop_codon:yes gene_type:complete
MNKLYGKINEAFHDRETGQYATKLPTFTVKTSTIIPSISNPNVEIKELSISWVIRSAIDTNINVLGRREIEKSMVKAVMHELYGDILGPYHRMKAILYSEIPYRPSSELLDAIKELDELLDF